MNNFGFNTVVGAIALAGVTFATPAVADDGEFYARGTIGGMATGNSGVDDTYGLSAGGGYDFGYVALDGGFDFFRDDLDVTMLSFSAVANYDNESPVTPYAGFGLGLLDVDGAYGEDHGAAIVVTGGVDYAVMPDVRVGPEYRYIYGIDVDVTERNGNRDNFQAHMFGLRLTSDF